METDGFVGKYSQPCAHNHYTIRSRLTAMSMRDEYLIVILALKVRDFMQKCVFKDSENRSILLKALWCYFYDLKVIEILSSCLAVIVENSEGNFRRRKRRKRTRALRGLQTQATLFRAERDSYTDIINLDDRSCDDLSYGTSLYQSYTAIATEQI